MGDHEETAKLVIPPHQIRHNCDDTKRTRLLKDVLRSTAKLQEAEGASRQTRKFGLSADGPRLGRTDRSRKPGPRTVSLTDLVESHEADRVCAELANVGGESSHLLQDCGERISGICSRLQSAEKHLKAASIKTRQLPSEGAPAAAASDDVRIVDRPEEAPSIVRARNDRVVHAFVTAHARFGELERFKERIDKAEGYDGLRAIFPNAYKHHPNMVLLDDNIFSEPGKMTAAIWHTAAPTSSVGGDTGFRSRLQGRSAMHLEVSTGSPTGRKGSKLSRLRSVPSLL